MSEQRLTFNGDALTFGGDTLFLFPGVQTVPRARGDDGGVRRRFWRKEAEKWLEKRYEDAVEVIEKPRKARRKFARAFVRQAEEYSPVIGPQIDIMSGIIQRMDSSVDMVELAGEMLVAMEQIRRRRRRNDDAVILLLSAY